MLIPIKTYYASRLPAKQDFIDAKQMCIDENCVVELRWHPNAYAGWYHIYIMKDSDIDSMYERQVPKVYGV
jgi:hypothetical protein